MLPTRFFSWGPSALRGCAGKAGGRRGITRKAAAVLLFFSLFLAPLFCSYGAQPIVLCYVGERDQDAMALLKKYLGGKGYTVTSFEGADTVEKHVELANKINKLKPSLFIAAEFTFGEEEKVMVAVAKAKKGTGQIMAIEEVPALHLKRSREFAALVAEAFERKVLDLPLFPLLGIDAPGVFVRIQYPKDQANAALTLLGDCVRKFLSKGMKNEGKRKSK